MIIHKCDRCGAEIEDVPHAIAYPDEHNIEYKGFELCDKCFGDFKEWLNKRSMAKKTVELPCQLCDFKNFENCPHGCFFNYVFFDRCVYNECQFSDDNGRCYFTSNCEAFKKAL